MRGEFLLGLFIAEFAFGAAGDVDRSFEAELPDNHYVTAITEDVDGKLIIGGYEWPPDDSFLRYIVLRLREDGGYDHTFKVHPKEFQPEAEPYDLVVRPDGNIGVLSGYSANLLSRKGVVDASYGLDMMPVLGTGGFLPDGSVVVNWRTNVYSRTFAQLRILDPSGRTTFQSAPIGPLNIRSGPETHFIWSRALPDRTIIGGVANIVSTYYHPPPGGFDGRRTDYYFYSSAWGLSLAKADSRGPVDGGKIYGVPVLGPTNTIYLASNATNGLLTRRLFNWELDPSFNFEFKGEVDALIRSLAVQEDGKVIYSTFNAEANHIFRCNSDGSHDSTFDTGSGANGEVFKILLLRSGGILVYGSFTRFNGAPVRGIIRLTQS